MNIYHLHMLYIYILYVPRFSHQRAMFNVAVDPAAWLRRISLSPPSQGPGVVVPVVPVYPRRRKPIT